MVNPKPKWCSTGQSQSFPGIGWLHQSSCLYHSHGYTPEGLYSASDVYVHWFIKCLWRACYVYTRRKKCDDDTLISTAVALRLKWLFYDSRANITYFQEERQRDLCGASERKITSGSCYQDAFIGELVFRWFCKISSSLRNPYHTVFMAYAF